MRERGIHYGINNEISLRGNMLALILNGTDCNLSFILRLRFDLSYTFKMYFLFGLFSCRRRSLIDYSVFMSKQKGFTEYKKNCIICCSNPYIHMHMYHVFPFVDKTFSILSVPAYARLNRTVWIQHRESSARECEVGEKGKKINHFLTKLHIPLCRFSHVKKKRDPRIRSTWECATFQMFFHSYIFIHLLLTFSTYACM